MEDAPLIDGERRNQVSPSSTYGDTVLEQLSTAFMFTLQQRSRPEAHLSVACLSRLVEVFLSSNSERLMILQSRTRSRTNGSTLKAAGNTGISVRSVTSYVPAILKTLLG